MKPLIEAYVPSPEASFRCGRVATKRFPARWHQHNFHEIVSVRSGFGQRMVGDDIAPFGPGDLVLLGPNLPHTWSSSPESCDNHAIVIQFDAAQWGETFLALDEFLRIRNLLNEARGLRFDDDAQAAMLLDELLASQQLDRLIALFKVLERLSVCPCTPLASEWYSQTLAPKQDHTRIDRVCQYIFEHFDRELPQAEVANLIGMGCTSFSRFFRRNTGKTFSQYLQELRIGHACELLETSERSITDIALSCGFNNLSNFNRIFRRLKHMTPRSFRQHHRHQTH